ncbi:unnamed protein product [Ectocarpus sp. 8 AP-2014]
MQNTSKGHDLESREVRVCLCCFFLLLFSWTSLIGRPIRARLSAYNTRKDVLPKRASDKGAPRRRMHGSLWPLASSVRIERVLVKQEDTPQVSAIPPVIPESISWRCACLSVCDGVVLSCVVWHRVVS